MEMSVKWEREKIGLRMSENGNWNKNDFTGTGTIIKSHSSTSLIQQCAYAQCRP